MPRILTSYFVVMIEHKSGLEAVVRPEWIRRDIVDLIKNDRDYDPDKIAYIHHCDFGTLKDVTDELIDEALTERRLDDPHHYARQRLVDAADHLSDLRRERVL